MDLYKSACAAHSAKKVRFKVTFEIQYQAETLEMSNRKGIVGLRSITEHKDEEFLSKRWEDFDHSQKMSLGVWGSAWIVRDRVTSTKYVLQSCNQSEWTLPRLRLLELARRRSDLFVAPKFMFFRGETAYVCSNIGGICLAELIDSTMAIQESQAAAIIRQVLPPSRSFGHVLKLSGKVDSYTTTHKYPRYLL